MAKPPPLILKALAQRQLGWVVHGYPWRCAGRIPIPDKHPQALCTCGGRVFFDLVLQIPEANMHAIGPCGKCCCIWWIELLPAAIAPLKVRPA